jgi:predicted oxidoreductase (fatty acid repression mutant protein)
MSLDRDAWKKVLDQPKNLGLKAGGGTGVGKALDKVGEKETAYGKAKTVANGQPLEAALIELKRLCTDVVKKHKKLFTTACQHLEKVIASADTRMRDLTAEFNVLRAQEQQAKTRRDAKAALSQLCNGTIQKFRSAQTEKALRDEFATFKAQFAVHAKGLPSLNDMNNRIKAFDKKDPKGLLGIRGDFISLVQEAATAAS